MFTPLPLALLFASLAPGLPPAALRYVSVMGGIEKLPCVRPERLRWTLESWGNKGTEVDEIGPGRERIEIRLPKIPYADTIQTEGQRVVERDANGQVKIQGGGSAREALTRAALDSGSWLLGGAKIEDLGRDGKGRAQLEVTPTGGLPTVLSFEESGDLQEAVYHLGAVVVTVDYLSHGTASGRHLARTVVERRSSEGESTVRRLSSLQNLDRLPPFPALASRVDWHLPQGRQRIELPLSLYAGRWIQLPITIGGQPAIFLLDTGADMTVLDLAAAKRLGIRPTGELAQLAGIFKRIFFIRSPGIQLGGARVDPQTLAALDLATGEFGENFPGIDGILGYDFLSRFVVVIDYPAARLTLIPRATFTPAPDDAPVPATLDGSSLLIQVAVGKSQGDFLLDTGSGGGILVQNLPGQAELVSEAERLHKIPKGARFGSGQADLWGAWADVQVGPYRWGHAPIAVVDPRSARGSSFAGAGNVGAGYLCHFRLTVDLAGPRVWLAQELPFRGAERAASFGLQLLREGGRLVARSLTEQGPAARAGLKDGDEILAVDGLRTRTAGHFLSQSLTDPSPGERLQLILGRKCIDKEWRLTQSRYSSRGRNESTMLLT